MAYGWIAVANPFQGNPGVDALVRAIELNDMSRATELIRAGLGRQTYHPPDDDKRWCFPIHLAAFNGRHEIVALLLAEGIDSNARDFQGYTPLMYLCGGCDVQRSLDYEKSLKNLFNSDADVNATSMSGDTALHIAHYPTFLVEALLEAGADPNYRNGTGNTAIHTACTGVRLGPNGSSSDAVSSLLVAGTDPSIVNNAGLTPMQLAVKEGRGDIVAILERFQRLSEVIQGRNDVRKSNDSKDGANKESQ